MGTGRPKRAKIGFFIKKPHTKDKIADLPQPGRWISKSQKGYAYVVEGSQITGSNVKNMERTKAKMMNFAYSKNGERGDGTFYKAKDIAEAELIQYLDGKKAAFLSRLVAHDLAGSGPISLLLEDKEGIDGLEIVSSKLPIFVHTPDYGRCETNLWFADTIAFNYYIDNFIRENDVECADSGYKIEVSIKESVANKSKPQVGYARSAYIWRSKLEREGLYGMIKTAAIGFKALAYLWLAIDAGLSIIITEDSQCCRTAMSSALTSLIPQYRKIVVLEKDTAGIKFREHMFNTIILYDRLEKIEKAFESAFASMPGILLFDEIKGNEEAKLLRRGNLAFPFIATMRASQSDDLVKTLLEIMGDTSANPSMLDIRICMKSEGGDKAVSEISEYAWLSRAEIEGGVEIPNGDSFTVSKILSEKKMVYDAVKKSKALANYSALKGLSGSYVAKEFERRTLFLENAFQKSKNDYELYESIARYTTDYGEEDDYYY